MKITVPPSDTVSVSGRDVLLHCETEETGNPDWLEWSEYITDPSGLRIWSTITNITDPDKYDIQGQYNLVINDVNVTDGGKYGCRLFIDSTARYTAELTVFGK